MSIQLTTNAQGYVTGIEFSVTGPSGQTYPPLQMQPIFIGETTPLLVRFNSFQFDVVGPWDSQQSTFSSGQGYITYTVSNGPLTTGTCPTGFEPAEAANTDYGPLGASVNSTVTQAFPASGAAGLGVLASHLDAPQSENEVYYLGFDSNLYRLAWDWGWGVTPATGSASPSKAPSVAPGTGVAPNVNTIYNGNEVFYLTTVGGNLHIEQLWGPSLSATDLTAAAAGGKAVAPASTLVGYVDSIADTDNVFYIGADQLVHALTWSPGAPWVESVQLDDVTRPAAAVGSALSGHMTPSSEEIFYLGANQHVYELWRWSKNFDGWHTTDVTAANGMKALAAAGSPLAGFYDPAAGNDALFYLGTNQHVNELLFRNSVWSGLDLTGNRTPAASNSSLAAHVNTIANSEEVYFEDANQNVDELWASSSTPQSWNFANVAGAPPAFPGSALTTDISTLDSTDHVFYVGEDLNLHELWWNGSWHAADDTTQTNPTAPNAVP